MNDQMTVLGAPMIGIICLCVAVSVLPVVGFYLALIAVPIAVLCFVPFFWVVLRFPRCPT